MKFKLNQVHFSIRKRLLMNIMRTFIFLCYTIGFAISPSDIVSQNTKIIIEEDISLSVDEVFKLIMNQTDYKFFYEKGTFKDIHKVKVTEGVVNVNKLLVRSLSNGNFDIEVTKKNVILIKQRAVSESIKKKVQEHQITGTIVDKDGNPLPGASIMEKGTIIGTVTDFDGKFSLSVSDENAILVVTYLGFATQEIAVGDQTSFTITLQEDASALDEVVLIGYGSQRKSDLTGAVTVVKLKAMDEVPVVSVDQALVGRVGGVQINQSSGQAGAGTSIRIRGGNSINGTNEPLFVIDGFPIINDNGAFAAGGPLGLTNSGSGNAGQGNPNGALNWLNPADIESVQVLKDASATAIYGSRGANGVIIITTKKGRAREGRINYNVSTVSSRLNTSNIELMNAKEYATYLNQRADNLGLQKYYTGQTIDGIYYPTPDELGNGTNWIDEVSRNDLAVNHSLDFNGGSLDQFYSGSIGWTEQNSPLIGSELKRLNLRLNFKANLTSYLKLDNTISYSNSWTDNSPADSRDVQKYGLWEAALVTSPIEPARNPDGSLNYSGGDPSNSAGPPKLSYNPIALGTDILNRNTSATFMNNLSLKLDILDGLSLETRGSIFKNDVLRDIYYNSNSTFNGFMVGGLAGKNTNNSVSFLTETFINYKKEFGKNVLSALAGFSYQQSTFRSQQAGASGFPNDNLLNENLSAGNTTYPTVGNKIEDLLSSYFVRVNNIYNDKYILTFTARYDGSSKFAEGNKWAFFPSGAFSWRISQEDFLKDSEALSDLKLRVSYGLSGNQAISSLQTKSTIGFNQYPYGGVLQTGVFPSVLGNEDLTWETTTQFNVGMDFGLWNQRLTGSINYYDKKTTDLIQFLPIPSNSGFSQQLTNLGSLTNKGIELELQAIAIDKGDLRWTIDANIAKNKQSISDLGVDSGKILMPFNVVGGNPANVALIEGEPVGLFYGHVRDGLFRTAAEIANGPTIGGEQVGDKRFKDLNNDGVINDQDRQVIGDPNPDFIFGLTNNFTYKRFNLGFTFQGSIGGDVWNLGNFVQERLGNRSKAANDYFTANNTDAVYSAPGLEVGRGNHSDFSVEDGSFIRLKTINIGYNVPVESIKFARSFRIYASATNLFTITNYSGFDPEVNSFAQSNLFRNIDILSIPQYKNYSLGVNIGL